MSDKRSITVALTEAEFIFLTRQMMNLVIERRALAHSCHPESDSCRSANGDADQLLALRERMCIERENAILPQSAKKDVLEVICLLYRVGLEVSPWSDDCMFILRDSIHRWKDAQDILPMGWRMFRYGADIMISRINETNPGGAVSTR